MPAPPETARHASSEAPLIRRLQRWRWQAPILALVLVFLQQVAEHTILIHLNRWEHFLSQFLFYGIVGPLLAWWALSLLYHSVLARESAHRSLEATHERLQRANQRLAFLMSVNRRLEAAEDEEALLNAVLELPGEIAPVVATTFIRYDERGRPLPAYHHGDLSADELEQWTNLLASPAVHQACQACKDYQASPATNCPLLAEAPPAVRPAHVHCLPITRFGRDYGVLNVFIAEGHTLSEHERELMAALKMELSLALEGHYYRTRELAALYRLQQARELRNLHDALGDILIDVIDALELDGGCLFLLGEDGSWRLDAQTGELMGNRADLIRGFVIGLQDSEEPLLIGDLSLSQDDDASWSLALAPLRVEDETLGCLAVWANAPKTITRRHRRVMAAMAAQAALLLENQKLYLHASHQAALAERSRLAREIHDGLAQTLGFLKLRTAQIEKWLHEGDRKRASDALHQIRELIAGAYLDAREAIDGLRLQPGDGDITDWLIPLLEDFRALCSIDISTTPPPPLRLPAEIQAQLLRITQEALGNVRKHSGATRVLLDWESDETGLTLRIIDNGRGFSLDDVPPLSRHGLRIMQERAELLAASFMIESRPDHGTQVIVKLPAYTYQHVQMT